MSGLYGAGRDSGYSVAIRSYRGHWGLLGGVGPLRGIRDVRGVVGGWQGL